MTVWCSPDHAVLIALQRLEKKKTAASKKKAKEEKAKLREAKLKLKRRADYLKEAERAVNAYIQRRDRGLKCVSCGCEVGEVGHASHYRSVGSSPALRYDPANIHRSCVKCNLHLHGNPIPYRVELIKRIGLAEVERLEGPQPVMKWAIPDLIAIKAKYSRMARELEKQNGNRTL